MNYCIVAFAIVVIISLIQWIVDGRKNYKGPQLDVNALVNGQVEGLNPETTEDKSRADMDATGSTQASPLGEKKKEHP